MFIERNLKVLFLILLVSSLYFFTLAPDVYLEDSGELISVAYFLGIAHPSGYPLYLLLGKAFSFLPFGTVAFRLNLMSAAFGGVTAFMIFLTLGEVAAILNQKNKFSDWLAFGLALLFAVSRDFWSQAIVAEVYTLNAFLVCLLIFIFLRWFCTRQNKYLFLLAWISGLGLTNHQLFGLVLPILWTLTYLLKPEVLNWQRLWKLVILFLLGLSVYFYLPIRALTHPLVNFTNLAGISDAIHHILRSSYNDFAPFAGQYGGFLTAFLRGLVQNLSLLVVLSAGAGTALLLLRKQIELWILFFLGFGASVLLPIFLRRVSFSPETEFVYRVYYFQAYIFVVILAFVFLVSFKRFQWFLIITLVLLSVVKIYQNFPQVDLHDNSTAVYYEQKLQSFKPNAIYLLVGEGYDYDSELFTLLYLQRVKDLRPDISIIDASRLFYVPKYHDSNSATTQPLRTLRRDYLELVLKKFPRNSPLYASFPVEAYSEEFVSEPTGYAIRVISKQQKNPKPVFDFSLPVIAGHRRENWDLAYQDFLASHFYQQALYWEALGKGQRATDFLVSAIQMDNQVFSEDYQAFQIFRSKLTIDKK